MRITAGIWRSRQLRTIPAARVRPTMDRVRKALFDALCAYSLPEGAVVADLFAGTGALGLEALSRGAAFCVFIEQDRRLTAALHRTLHSLGAAPSLYRIVTANVFQVLPRWQLLGLPRPQLVLADPPYRAGFGERLLQALALSGWMPPESLLCLELSRGEQITAVPHGWELSREQHFGETHLQWWHWHGPSDATGALPGDL